MLLVAAGAGFVPLPKISSADGGNPWTAVWSIWSNCDCSGPANAEHIVPVCATYGTIARNAVQIDCSADGLSVTVHEYSDSLCVSGEVTVNTTYPVGQCLPNTPANGVMMSTFKCVRNYTAPAQSIVGRQYDDTTCGADAKPVIAEASYVSGCFLGCSGPTSSDPLPNLFQVADSRGLAGSYCNGTDTCTSPCAPDGQISVGYCQVLAKSTSIKYTYWQGL